MALDKTRFQRVPGGGTRRYVDKQTGETVSYRQAINLSAGRVGEVEKKVKRRRQQLGIKRDTPSAIGALRRARLEKLWRKKRGTDTRGPNIDPEFENLVKDLKAVGKLGYRGQRGWVDVLESYNLIDKGDNLDDFFIT